MAMAADSTVEWLWAEGSSEPAAHGEAEIFDALPVASVSIRREAGHIVAAGSVQTHRTSIARTRNNIALGLAQLVLQALDQPEPRHFEAGRPAPRPRRSRLAKARHLGQLVRALGERLAFSSQWILGVATVDPTSPALELPARFVPLIPPRDRFWADPCVVEQGGRTWVFFEEALRRSAKGVDIGHLSVAELAADGSMGQPQRVLDLDHHLSYPMVFEHKGDWFLVPESSATGRIDLYRCRRWPHGWEFECTLLHHPSAVDASLMEWQGTWWLFFATSAPGAPTSDYLELYAAPTLRGPYVRHPQSPVVSDARWARPAGKLFVDQGRLIRPAQDSGGGVYGRAVHFREVTELDHRRYAEREVSTLQSDRMAGTFATHTFSRAGRFVVIDGCRKVPRLGLTSRSSAGHSQ